MIVVDTSVWVEAFRRGTSPAASHLRELLDADVVALAAPVRIEILSGANRANRVRLQRLLAALPTLDLTEGAWSRIERWVLDAAEVGDRFGVADLLVASIATDHGAEIWSLDGDFRRMAALGFVTLHRSS